MRISEISVWLVLLLGGLAVADAGASAAEYGSPEAAYAAGRQLLADGDAGSAASAFREASDAGLIRARYALASLYADNGSPLVDPAEAFTILSAMVDVQDGFDPVESVDARYVGYAHVRLAAFYRSGVPELGIEASLDEARHHLDVAATMFDDTTAQFELAQSDLAGEGGPERVVNGMDWLVTLAQDKNFPAAQLYLGDLYWRGEGVTRNPALALALSALALEGASASDKLWYEESYHARYCGTDQATRQQAWSIVATWDEAKPLNHPEIVPASAGSGIAVVSAEGEMLVEGDAVRTCADGEPILTPDHLTPAESLPISAEITPAGGPVVGGSEVPATAMGLGIAPGLAPAAKATVGN